MVWHLRALRYRRTLWRDFRERVSDWLQAWQPPTDKLLIVGPSGGYTLDDEFLKRWQEIVAIEPDPLARRLLCWRYPQVRWRFSELDILHRPGNGLLPQHFPAHAILFANVLGQLAPRAETESRKWLRALRADLGALHWASYHDVISTRRTPDVWSPRLTESTDLDGLLGHFWRGGELDVVDHGTHGLGQPDAEAADYCVWPLRPGHYHLVEWLVGRPVTPQAQDDQGSDAAGKNYKGAALADAGLAGTANDGAPC